MANESGIQPFLRLHDILCSDKIHTAISNMQRLVIFIQKLFYCTRNLDVLDACVTN